MPAKYEKIATELRRKIRAGDLAPGDQLPTEDQLQAEHRASAGTVREALDMLRAEGLVETKQGIGSFVRAPRRRVRRTGERHQLEKDRVHLPRDERQQEGAVEFDTGLKFPDIKFDADYDADVADEELGERFGIPAGTAMLHRHYTSQSKAEDAPVSLIDSWIIYDVAAANPDLLRDENEPWPGGTMHQLSTVGIEIDHIIEEFSARPPSQEERELLNISEGVSVLFLRKTSVDTEGRVVEYSEVVMPGDRTVMQYTTQLKRWPA
jgi:GntR family transcriptional regulator